MGNIKFSDPDFINKYKISIFFTFVFALFFMSILHFTLDKCAWVKSFVEAFLVSIVIFIVIPSQFRMAVQMIPKLIDELIGILSLTVWASAFWAGWLFYSGQISADGNTLSKAAKITEIIFIMETNIKDNVILSFFITAFVVLVNSTSWGLRRVLHIERKALSGIKNFPFGITIEYDKSAIFAINSPEFRVYIDPGRLATTLIMKCFCAAAGAIIGFGMVLKICCPKASTISLGEILMAGVEFTLPMIIAAIMHEFGNKVLDAVFDDPRNALSIIKKKLAPRTNPSPPEL